MTACFPAPLTAAAKAGPSHQIAGRPRTAPQQQAVAGPSSGALCEFLLAHRNFCQHTGFLDMYTEQTLVSRACHPHMYNHVPKPPPVFTSGHCEAPFVSFHTWRTAARVMHRKPSVSQGRSIEPGLSTLHSVICRTRSAADSSMPAVPTKPNQLRSPGPHAGTLAATTDRMAPGGEQPMSGCKRHQGTRQRKGGAEPTAPIRAQRPPRTTSSSRRTDPPRPACRACPGLSDLIRDASLRTAFIWATEFHYKPI